jgi:hypothetical protein
MAQLDHTYSITAEPTQPMACLTPVAGFQNIEQVLAEARNTLRFARLGLEDHLRGSTGTRRSAGLRNAVVFGRSVTWVLQNLRSFDRDAFNAWYAPFETAMREDPGFKYLVELRNQFEKQGRASGVSTSFHIGHLNLDTWQQAIGPAPPGATGQFLDGTGASGWTVRLADGTEESFYVQLPPALQNQIIVASEVKFAEPIGKVQPPDEEVHQLLTRYLDYLGHLVDAANHEFAPA